MVAISDNVIGVDVTDVYTAEEAATGVKPRPFKTGQTVRMDDGALYQFATATSTISSSNTSVNITLVGDVYQAANSGGDAENNTGSVIQGGDSAWFKLA